MAYKIDDYIDEQKDPYRPHYRCSFLKIKESLDVGFRKQHLAKTECTSINT